MVVMSPHRLARTGRKKWQPTLPAHLLCWRTAGNEPRAITNHTLESSCGTRPCSKPIIASRQDVRRSAPKPKGRVPSTFSDDPAEGASKLTIPVAEEGRSSQDQYQCGRGSSGCPQVQPGADGYHKDVRTPKFEVYMEGTPADSSSRLVDGAGQVQNDTACPSDATPLLTHLRNRSSSLRMETSSCARCRSKTPQLS
jgi:hypothetical protein